MDYRAELDTSIARFDQFAQRHDGRPLGPSAGRRKGRGGTPALARKLATVLLVAVAVLLATAAIGLAVDGIGLTGLFVALAVMVVAVLVIGLRPARAPRPVAPYREDMPIPQVVQRLGTLLTRHRTQLPPAAGQRLTAIQGQLPMLEKQLADVAPLDPLAQDARRLMGEHLPELIERYERVPAQYRRERDGDGVSVDERLVSGLDAASAAIDDLGRRLSKQEMDEFSTQGRFLESRYRDDPSLGSAS